MKRSLLSFVFITILASTFIYCQSLNLNKKNNKEIENKSNKVKTTKKSKEEKTAEKRKKLVDTALKYLGTPYKYTGTTKEGMDCSGLVYRTALDALSYKLPRSSSAIAAAVKRLKKDEKPKIADLIFFNTSGSGVSHVAIYLGKKRFIHSASSGARRGVIISSLEEPYWKNCFLFFGSVFD